MGYLANLLVKLGMDTSEFTAGMDKSSRAVSKFGSDLESVGMRASVGISAPLIGVGIAALKASGALEQNAIAFKAMMGSAEAANKHLEDLKQFAAKTPFEFNDLVLASKRMQALGFASKDVLPSLRNIGDAASALGMGSEGIMRIVTALGQMKAKGAVQAEEMRQLAEAGIPAWQILAKTLNTDVAGAMKAVEARAVDAGTAVPAILAGINARFGGLMDAQSKTLLGQFSNLKDSLNFTLQDIGKTLAPAAKSIMENAIAPALNKVKELAAGFATLPAPLQNVVLGTGAAAAAFPLLVTAMGLTITNAIVVGGVLGKLASVIGTLALSLGARGLLSAMTAFQGGLALSAVSIAGWAAGLAIVAYAAYDVTKALVSLKEASDKVKATEDEGRKVTDKLAEALKRHGVDIETLESRYRAGQITFDTYRTKLEELAKAHADASAAVQEHGKQQMTIEAALKALGIESTEVRQKNLDKAREAYRVLSDSGTQSAGVMADALKKVKTAEEELIGKTEKLTEKFRALAFGDRSLTNALITKEVQDAAKAQTDAVNWIAQFRERVAKEGEFWKVIPEMPDPTVNAQHGVDTLGQVLKETAPDARSLADAMQDLGVASDKLNIPKLEADFVLLDRAMQEGKITAEQLVLAWVNLVKAKDAAGQPVDPALLKEAVELEKQYGGQMKEVRKEQNLFQREVERTFNNLARGLADSIVNWKGWKDNLLNIGKQLASSFLEIMIRQLLKPLEAEFAKLAGWIGKTLGIGGGAAGSAASAAASGAAGAAGSAGSAAGSAGSGVAGAASSAASGAAAWVGAIGSAVSAVSGVIGNFQQAGMNKSLDVIVNHTLATANELTNLRRDQWDRHYGILAKMDMIFNRLGDMWQSPKGGTGSTFNFYTLDPAQLTRLLQQAGVK